MKRSYGCTGANAAPTVCSAVKRSFWSPHHHAWGKVWVTLGMPRSHVMTLTWLIRSASAFLYGVASEPRFSVMSPSWLPLESSPDVLNPFVHRLGLPESFGFNDVFGLDPELLCMVPQPCVALCLLYPSENISGVRRADQREKQASQPPPPDGLFFCMQHDGIGNACGTIACAETVSTVTGDSAVSQSEPWQ